MTVGLGWMLVAAALAAPADRALSLLDASSDNTAINNAHRAADIGGRVPNKSHRYAGGRSAAWIAVGRLGVLDEEVLENADQALLTTNNHESVRSTAAWALGELGRSRSWSEVQPISKTLQQSMSVSLSADTAYYVDEAFGKVYTPHEHSFEENLEASRALNTLAANQRVQLPDVYYVVLNRILTFDVAIQLLRDSIKAARSQQDEQRLSEAYAAVLLTVRWLASHQEQLISNLGNQQQAIGAAFDALLDVLSLEDRRVTLMLMWSFGNVASEPAFAALVGEQAAGFADNNDPMVRMITAWSLYRLRTALPARESLRGVVLSREADARILEMLAQVRVAPNEMDAVQKLYAVEPR